MSSNVARVEPKQTQLATLTPAGSPMGSALVFLQNGGNIDQLNQMMDLQARWETNEARKAFTVAMTGFKAEPVEIFKRKNVSYSGTNYNHAELCDVTDGIGPALAKHELSYRWNVKQAGSAITVDCILTHVAGHSETVSMTGAPDDSGRKNAIQQVASTTTYLQRYTLLAITGMSTKGMDNDGRGDERPVEIDSSVADWIAAAEAIESLDEYATRKAELLKHYGEQRRVPKSVQTAFAAKNKQLQVPA